MSPSPFRNKFCALQEYDKEVESNPRRLLPRKNASHIPVPPPVFDIYLCDNCDGEFDTLTDVQVNFMNLCVRVNFKACYSWGRRIVRHNI
jgi:hypothetical protein